MNTRNLPKYNLSSIKLAFNQPSKLRMTGTAMQGQYELAFSDQDVVDVIQSLLSTDFYKSMKPSNNRFTAWQDVYKPTHKGIKLYVKFQIQKHGEIIVSFKAR